MDGTIVIGEGERDEAPMLFIGEQVGQRLPGQPQVDIAVDPLEGTNLVALGQANAITVLAASERGGLLHAPDTYFEKLCVGPPSAGHVDLDPAAGRERAAHRRLAATARCATSPSSSSSVPATRRSSPRCGPPARASSSSPTATSRRPSACAVSGTGVHGVMGIGGAPEGVITAAALRCLGGEIQARFRFRNDEERQRAERMGHADPDRVYRTEDLAPGTNLVFSATGVTEGDLLQGVRFFGGGARTHSLVMGYQTKQVRFVDTVHMFDRDKPPAVRL